MRIQGLVGVLFGSHRANAVPFHRYINYTETVSACLRSCNSTRWPSSLTRKHRSVPCTGETCASCRWPLSCFMASKRLRIHYTHWKFLAKSIYRRLCANRRSSRLTDYASRASRSTQQDTPFAMQCALPLPLQPISAIGQR
jgi:hypothetical protein